MEEQTDPDSRDKNAAPANSTRITKYIMKTFPGLELEPSIIENCMYTMSPDHTSIIDFVPATDNNIAFACGFSGTGFKKAPEIGRMLVEMLSGKPVTYDRKPFALTRFKNKARL